MKLSVIQVPCRTDPPLLVHEYHQEDYQHKSSYLNDSLFLKIIQQKNTIKTHLRNKKWIKSIKNLSHKNTTWAINLIHAHKYINKVTNIHIECVRYEWNHFPEKCFPVFSWLVKFMENIFSRKLSCFKIKKIDFLNGSSENRFNK